MINVFIYFYFQKVEKDDHNIKMFDHNLTDVEYFSKLDLFQTFFS
jgi:hypothetical protein